MVRLMPFSTFDCTLPVAAGSIPYGLMLPPSLESPKRQAESCPDDCKSTNFILPYLYQISRLPVKKNCWMVEIPGVNDTSFQSPPQLVEQLCAQPGAGQLACAAIEHFMPMNKGLCSKAHNLTPDFD